MHIHICLSIHLTNTSIYLYIFSHLPEHDERLLNPGEDPECDVGGSALAKRVLVRDVKPIHRAPLANLFGI